LNADGSFSYTPAANYSGRQLHLSRERRRGGLERRRPWRSPSRPSTTRRSQGRQLQHDEDTPLTIAAAGVLGNDSDGEGSALHAVLVSGPAHGTLTLNADGSFTYTPAADYNGADSFTYRANDGEADSNVATVAIAVKAVNDAPVAATTATAPTKTRRSRSPRPACSATTPIRRRR
jgi:VCBS repeat-containing protein